MSVSSVSASTAQSSSPTSQLVKKANGEYTAASVDADQKDAMKLGLVKQKDGNYGTSSSSSSAAPSSSAAKSSSGVQSALSLLTIGG